MENVFVFDLDNTLIMTDALNNDSYNFALVELGLRPITDCVRITKHIAFERYSTLEHDRREELVALKKKYFKNNIYETRPNTTLIELVKGKLPDQCVLWTSAEPDRVKHLLEYYQLSHCFATIVHSSKAKIDEDIVKICRRVNGYPEQLIFFEDNEGIVHSLSALNQRVITVKENIY